MGFMLLIFVTFLGACSDSKEDNPELVKPPFENFSPANMNFTSEAGEQSFSFIANTQWVLSVASNGSDTSWCKVSSTSGSAGEQTIVINVSANDTYDDRSTTISIKAGTETKTFVVNQKQKDAILLTSNKFEVKQEGDEIEVEVKANVSYTAKIDELCKEWVKESANTRALTTTTKKFTISANEELDKREGSITFSDGTITETAHIYQAGGEIIILTKDEQFADAAGEEITVELRSNCDYEVVMPEVDWIKPALSR